MNKLLPQDFYLEQYGLSVRLVTENDTDFIMSLRTDEQKSRYIHKTENDVQKHLEWFKKYKIRESEGRDYYFIYFDKDNKPVGLNRIYNIYDYYGTPGSWLCPNSNKPETTIATYFIGKNIAFEILGLDLLVFDVRKQNKSVWKLHQSLGAQKIGESDIDYYYSMSKDDYMKLRDKYSKLFKLSDNFK